MRPSTASSPSVVSKRMLDCTHLDRISVDLPEEVSLEPGENWSYCYVDDFAFAA